MKRFRRQTGILFLIVMVDLLLALNLARLAGGERKVCVSEGESALPVSEAGDGTLERGTGNGGRTGGGGEEPGGENRFLALTFDDGPHPVCTKELLDGLRERNVKASFFLLGENIPGNEQLIRQMKEDGHLIGTHCYRHVDLTKEDAETAISMIRKTNREIEAVTGEEPVYIRPPYGKWNGQLEDALDMKPVLWDIDTLDWKSQNSGKVLRSIERNAGKHQIVLMHDIFPTTVDAALAAIDTLGEQGYTFVTVDELLID